MNQILKIAITIMIGVFAIDMFVVFCALIDWAFERALTSIFGACG
jgi:hypothetical protein